MYITSQFQDEIFMLKKSWEYEKAIEKLNSILSSDPTNEFALLEIADIKYQMWDIESAEKPVDFLLTQQTFWDESLKYYVKWAIELDKQNFSQSKKYLKKALEICEFENSEILRCYGLAEYRSWNREKWIDFVEKAFDKNNLDAEIILNLIELYTLSSKIKLAKKIISHYEKNHKKIETFDKEISYYDTRLNDIKNILNN